MKTKSLKNMGFLAGGIAFFSALLQLHGTPGLAWDGHSLLQSMTAHFVHYNWKHWALNMSGLALVAIMAPQWGARGFAARIGLIAVGIDVALWWRGIPVYYGLSGALHGLWLWALLDTMPSWFSLGGITLIFGKIAQEQLLGVDSAYQAWLGFPVATIAHASGAVTGVLGFACLYLWQHRAHIYDFLSFVHRQYFNTISFEDGGTNI